MITVENIINFNKGAKKYAESLVSYAAKYDVNTPLRFSHFIAQVAHESGNFVYVEEIASGKAYEGRKDLGNTQPGDGVWFKGRGLIQVTGRNNYIACSNYLFSNDTLVKQPKLLCLPEYAVASAFWFWNSRGLNALADADNIEKITRRINGGLNGFDDRKKKYELARSIFA